VSFPYLFCVSQVQSNWPSRLDITPALPPQEDPEAGPGSALAAHVVMQPVTLQ
jgi:hypothetical protein